MIHALHGEQDIRNMGGLKKDLPITYWTFVIGSLAIAGVPPLAGFFSKDEILFETFAEGHKILWVVGALTSLLTATYMFRLVFLTFHGERRHDAPAAAHAHDRTRARRAARRRTDMAHGSHLHDAPPAMALALIVLAIGSVLGRLHRRSAALGGHNELGAWLEPSFARAGRSAAQRRGGGEPRRRQARPKRTRRSTSALELTLMGVSSAIALGGIGLACVHLAASGARSPTTWRASFAPDPPAAAEQVLRGRALRRDDRAADQGRVAGRPVARR